MHLFKDCAGRDWTVAINVSAVKRVRGLVGVDLLKLVDDGFKPLGELVSDPCQLADVLFALCKAEADAKQITDEDFGRALAGDALERAADAFVLEYVDFFPSEKTRWSLRKVLDASKKATQIAQERAAKELDKLDPEALARTLTDSFGSLPGSSAPTQGP